jgi:hypothetical protein
LALTAAGLESLPAGITGAKILISLTFRDWLEGCDIIQRMDAFLANHTVVRKVEIITKHPVDQSDAIGKFPLLSTANKLGLGTSKETWKAIKGTVQDKFYIYPHSCMYFRDLSLAQAGELQVQTILD